MNSRTYSVMVTLDHVNSENKKEILNLKVFENISESEFDRFYQDIKVNGLSVKSSGMVTTIYPFHSIIKISKKEL